MPLPTHSTLAVRESDVRAVRVVLADTDLLTPQEIANRSNMTLTAVTSALNRMERAGEVAIVRQTAKPRVRVQLVAKKHEAVER